MLFSITTLYAQSEKSKHLEIGLSALFWNPSSLHLKATNTTTTIRPPSGNPYSVGAMSGYGNGFAPMFFAKYYFNDNLGIAFRFHAIHLLNELTVNTTDTSFEEYGNEAFIPRFSLGLAGKFGKTSSIKPFYELGATFIPGYDLEMRYHTNNYHPQDFNADGSALGLYFVAGIDIKLFKFIYLNTAFNYSFIPTSLDYTQTSGNAEMVEDTDLGGFGVQVGLTLKFL